MTTRADLNNLCRRRLADMTSPVEWSDIQINQWINDAIAEYSIHFPKEVTGFTITTTADQREYSLSSATGIQHITRVEYPQGDDPPTLLTWRDKQDPRGFWGGPYYDFEGSPPSTLIIGEKPSANETIEIDYLADHDYLDDDSDTVSVPDLHLELIVLFVRMAAMQELAAEEAKNPDTTTLMANTLALNAFRAQREYRTFLEQVKASQANSTFINWSSIID